MKAFKDLTEREVLAVAIAAEEEDSRIYMAFAEHLGERYPASARVFEGMAAEEDTHRRRLLALYEKRFGKVLPPIRREDVRGFLKRKPVWLMKALSLDTIRKQAEVMEFEAQRFYAKAAESATNVELRELLGDLARAEGKHERLAAELEEKHLTADAKAEEAAVARRVFVMQYVQPGLAGLMDGSVSTLAPIFAAAFATQDNWQTFLVGLAASIGAGISMGFAEALSDDGSMTGRGTPWLRGSICGLMTTLGGIGHTLPYLIPASWSATLGGIEFDAFHIATAIATLIVFAELWIIAWVRAHYMDTPFLRAAFQVVIGGVLVFLTGVAIGSA